MPQIDKVTFLTTIFWTFVLYFYLYLDLTVTYLYKFVTGMKLEIKRLSLVSRKIELLRLQARTFALSHWL